MGDWLVWYYKGEEGGTTSRFSAVVSSGGKRHFLFFFWLYMYIYIIYTPNLGFEIAVFSQEREQGCLKREQQGSKAVQQGNIEGALKEKQKGAADERESEPNVAATTRLYLLNNTIS